MNSSFSTREIQFLTGCLERARSYAVLLDRTLSSGSLNLGTARHCVIGIGGQLWDAQNLVPNLRAQLPDDQNRALTLWLRDTESVARLLLLNLDRNPLPPLDRELHRSRRLISRIDRTLELARDIAASIEQTIVPSAPSRSSRRLATWAVGLLPPAHRVRYREEFLAELHDLRDQQQLRHGLRLLVRAVSLRWALRAAEPAVERTR